jgi:twitching motility protein PilT
MARLDAWLKAMVGNGASDLFVSADSQPTFKVHGELKRANTGPLTPERCREMLMELLSPAQQERFLQTGDLDFAYELPDVARYRGNYFNQRKGMGGVFRMIPKDVQDLESLGLPKVVEKLALSNRGLVLVTGSTGSGKSTTLAAMIDLRNRTRSEHILTLEDPLEFVHENKSSLIHQRQIGEHSLNFATALRAALREAPDVILVGEMRDLETISLAITSAETGHVVFGTLHTSGAAKTVDRIIDAFPQEQQNQIRTMLGDTLRGVISQILLKRADHPGRVAALEVLISTPAMANLIREGKTFQIPSIIQTGKKEGMVALDQSIMSLLMARRITAEEAFKNAVSKELFFKYVMPPKGE